MIFFNHEAQGRKIIGVHSCEKLVELLKKPRRVMLLIEPGNPVDDVIQKLSSLLEEGDIIIDGGNSQYKDAM